MMHRQETVECLKKFNARRKLKVRPGGGASRAGCLSADRTCQGARCPRCDTKVPTGGPAPRCVAGLSSATHACPKGLGLHACPSAWLPHPARGGRDSSPSAQEGGLVGERPEGAVLAHPACCMQRGCRVQLGTLGRGCQGQADPRGSLGVPRHTPGCGQWAVSGPGCVTVLILGAVGESCRTPPG